MRKNQRRDLLNPVTILAIFLTILQQNASCQSSENHTIKFSDRNGTLLLNIDTDKRCVISRIEAAGKTGILSETGVCSSVTYGGRTWATSSGIESPVVNYDGDVLKIKDIKFGANENRISENWTLKADSDFVDWTIERTYSGNNTIGDTGFPEWSFDGMNTWTGALLGTGGVAWCRFFDKPNSSLGCHNGKVTFWNKTDNACLTIEPLKAEGLNVAVRFSRQPDDRFTLNYYVSEDILRTKHFLARFLIDSQDIWDEFDARGTVSITYRLRASEYDKTFYRGDFRGFRNESVMDVLNTIARVGVIDEKLMGSNNWHLDMGFVCLHEQWISLMGLAIDDPDYFSNYRKTLDYFRDNAIAADGDMKDRWACRLWDSEPFTYSNGFYECQWGDLLDANTDYPINVAELFQINGDTAWIRSHKNSCEKALGFLLSRDSDNDGLIETFSDSHTEKKGSDWIDVIWASWENAFINAKLYYALMQWAEIERISGDQSMAYCYSSFASKCKDRFNSTVSDGGFWSPENNWYVYWRDKDGSIHGDNLVTPVNFMAIAYGICDDSQRKKLILKKIEELMQLEGLFMWPISFFPYRPDEGYMVNYPFPNYENGDIFLAWAETGIRAYRDYDPAVPVKYIKNVLGQYEKDGLAYQRYGRLDQMGKGSDILANNCLCLSGLYRDIYGIQPFYNRICLDPRITDELNGTRIKYRLRERVYDIELKVNEYSVSSGPFTLISYKNFGLAITGDSMAYYNEREAIPSMIVHPGSPNGLKVTIIRWVRDHGCQLKWTMSAQAGPDIADCSVGGLRSGYSYLVRLNDSEFSKVTSNIGGIITFKVPLKKDYESLLEIREIEQ